VGNFACDQCGGEFYIPMKTSYACPNCNISLTDTYKPPENTTTTEYLVQVDNPLIASNPLEESLLEVLSRAYHLWRDRQEKYGPTNIASTGALGCFVRATDKLARLREVYLNGRGAEVSDETVIDSWLDLVNYAAMGLMCEEHTWPGT
jgi:hypothetical protein